MNQAESGRRVAVIDIGTNTILLLVAERAASGLCAVREEVRFGRLGQGLDRTGALAPEAVARSLAIVREYRAIIDELAGAGGPIAVRAAGTQALREASNSASFVEPARAILGGPIDTISGEREAQLVYRAVSESLPGLTGQRVVIADVGGGSTEIICAGADGVESFTSLPIGSVRLHERHLASDPPTADEIAALDADIDAALATVEIPADAAVVASAGTATTIGSVALELREYSDDRIQGLRLPRDVVQAQLDRYYQLTVAERRELPGLEPERADVVAAGTAIFARLLARTGADEMIINGHGVRWGLAHELAEQ